MGLDVLMQKLSTNPHQEILASEEGVYTCKDLFESVSQFREILRQYEVKNGDCVRLNSDYSLQSIAVLIALILEKCILIPTLPNDLDQRKNDLIRAIADIEIRFENSDICVNRVVRNMEEEHVLISRLKEMESSGLILFTSGTTGEPKGVVHNFESLLKKFVASKEELKAFRSVSILLFDHWGGLNTLFHSLFSLGFLALIQDRKPVTVAKAIEKHKLDLLPASPSFINLFLLSGVIGKHNLESLRWITYGAETMPESTLKRLHVLLPKVKLKQTYGLIEIGVLATKSQSDSSTLVKLGGAGYEIRIRDHQLEIKAESSMLGYLNADSPFTDDGFFKTGDYVEEHGEWVKILGRKSNLIFTAGEKVHPSEVETVILECEAVLDVRVFGKPHPLLGNVVAAEVKISHEGNKELIRNQILELCRSQLSRIKIPMYIEFTNKELFNNRLKKERRN